MIRADTIIEGYEYRKGDWHIAFHGSYKTFPGNDILSNKALHPKHFLNCARADYVSIWEIKSRAGKEIDSMALRARRRELLKAFYRRVTHPDLMRVSDDDEFSGDLWEYCNDFLPAIEAREAREAKGAPY